MLSTSRRSFLSTTSRRRTIGTVRRPDRPRRTWRSRRTRRQAWTVRSSAPTERATAIGDERWRALLGAHHAKVRALVSRYRGAERDTNGDGFLATFDGPARAVLCARAIADAMDPIDLEIRAGVHTGECHIDGNQLTGIAVHIGARVAALAGPGRVLVSGTVKDLVAGSGIEFTERGRHALKGVDGEWTLYEVATT